VTADLPKTADAVVVGGGTVGAWCAYFLRRAGLGNVVLIEKGVLGQGSSSRAAGVVRVQGGTPEAVRLGIWSRSFYLGQLAELGTDSGFVQQGYLLPCFTQPEVAAPPAGIAIPAGGVRHHVAVTEQHPAFASTPMAFDVPSGLYWRPEEGGLLFGMSDQDEPPGENRCVDFDYLSLMRSRLAALVPLTAGLGLRRAWAATIDFTPDHLPIIGPAPRPARVFVAAAGGAGMMWGPAVARAAADVALTGTSSVVDDVSMLGLDRFDSTGRSKLAPDPIALPFPEKAS
jgi:sarcosine oxidase subunit beta